MVKNGVAAFLLILVFSSRESIAQLPADTLSNESSAELYDPSQINNDLLLRIDENTVGEELQFIADDIERIASHPLLVKDATWQTLQTIPTLTGLDAFRILKNRKDGYPLSRDVLYRSQDFITTSSPSSHPNFLLRSRLVLDPE